MENTSSEREELSDVHETEDTCLNILPDEMLLEILSNLDIKSLCQINQTCKTFNTFLKNQDQLWRRHCLAIRSVCQSDTDEDREKGFTWQETVRHNYNKCVIKQQWLNGKFSNISSYSELPQNSMCPLSLQSWGEIMEAEFSTTKQSASV